MKNCEHNNIMKDNYGVYKCYDCGIEVYDLYKIKEKELEVEKLKNGKKLLQIISYSFLFGINLTVLLITDFNFISVYQITWCVWSVFALYATINNKKSGTGVIWKVIKDLGKKICEIYGKVFLKIGSKFSHLGDNNG